ncbi:hypothetical protein BVG16_00710 [Paenibacillus selenitireducens]|uniref:Methyl-accepting transducer domain-containing protein n=1 Tax=Paenibacillus selenitireducens TaxID=1324314 RepID=A0A1T2XML0_9BACL|nr:methyl-accepting chemotaxis protein [Paenibacillus selenitireducens]OPA80903.1 hypothetical protein BVG16_00710 [Paenibacillus selenitireducens]
MSTITLVPQEAEATTGPHRSESSVVSLPSPSPLVQSGHVSIRKFIVVPTVLTPTHTCREVVQMISRGMEGECLVVCDDTTKQPLGLLMKDRFYRFLGKKYGADLYYEKSIMKLMDTKPLIVDIHLSPQEMIDRALNRDELNIYDCVIVTEQGRFIGILTVGVLLKISRILQQQAAQTQLKTARGMEGMIDQIHISVQQVAEASNHGMMQSEHMVDLTLQGKNELDQVSILFQNIAEQATKQEKHIVELQQKTSSVSDITQFIRDMAEQSNLLAVNATIEAARAGEHGKGFAVVATEIRKLADETKRSAQAITEMIAEIDTAVKRTVRYVQSGRAETGNSAVLVTEAKERFQELFYAAGDHRKQVYEIHNHAKVADHKTNEVTQSISHIVEQLNKPI